MSQFTKKEIIETYVKGREEELEELFLNQGAENLRNKLDLDSEDEIWEVIFDYFVFEHNIIYKLAQKYSDHFLDSFTKMGPEHLRRVLEIDLPKYDLAWEPVFELIAVENGGLERFILCHLFEVTIYLQKEGEEATRSYLGLESPKYDIVWQFVLDRLTTYLCEVMYSDSADTDGLSIFTRLMNATREHKSLFISSKNTEPDLEELSE